MPRVPRYNGPQIQETGLPNARVSTNAPIEAFGGGSGLDQSINAAQRTMGVAQEIILEEKKKADDLATADAFARAVQEKHRLTYDTKEGLMTRKGRDSFGAPEEYRERYKKSLDDIENSLGNDDQKLIFKKIRLQQETDFHGSIEKHVFSESKAFDNEVTENGLKVAKDEAILNYQEKGRVEQSIKLQEALIQTHADRNGLPAEWVKVKTEEARSKTHESVINRMLSNGQDMQASKYFKENKENITGADQASLEKILEEGSLRGESQRRTDSIMTKFGTMTEALEDAKKINDPKLRDAVVARVKDEFSLKKVADAQAREQMFNDAANVIEKNGGNRDEIEPVVWAGLSLQERNAIDARARQLREGIPPATNWDKYYELKTAASSDVTRDKFLRENLMVYRPNMADAEFKELVNLQTALRKGDENVEATLDGYRTSSQIVNDTLASAGIDPSPKPGKKDSERVALFRRAVDEQVGMWKRQTGKKDIPTDEVQRIVDNLMVKGVTQSGWFWDTKKHVFELKGDESIAIDAKDIPRVERLKIEEALRKNNIAVSEEKIIELYNRKMSRMVPSGN